jgi:hypothetical protein
MGHGATACCLASLLADDATRGRVLGYGLLAAGALLLGALAVAVAKRWRRGGGERLSPSDQLAQFRSLYEQGAMSKEEFERVRALLGGQLRRDLGVTGGGQAAPAPPKTPPTPPTPDGPPPDAVRPAE